MFSVQGFTLLELIIVLIISMLLITIGIPGFNSLIENNRLSSAASNIRNHLQFARSQSLSLINYVTACPLENNKCTTKWISGIDVFTDANQNKIYDSGDVLLKEGDAFNANDKLVFPSLSVTYTPDGQITGTNATFRYCSGAGKIAVHIAYSGRTKIISGDTFTNCE